MVLIGAPGSGLFLASSRPPPRLGLSLVGLGVVAVLVLAFQWEMLWLLLTAARASLPLRAVLSADLGAEGRIGSAAITAGPGRRPRAQRAPAGARRARPGWRASPAPCHAGSGAGWSLLHRHPELAAEQAAAQRRRPAEADDDLAVLRRDLGHARLSGAEPQAGDVHQVLHRLGQRPEAVLQLLDQRRQRRRLAAGRQSLVEVQPGGGVLDVVGRDQRAERQVDRSADIWRSDHGLSL